MRVFLISLSVFVSLLMANESQAGSSSLESVAHLLDYAGKIATYPIFVYKEKAITILSLIGFIAIFVAGFSFGIIYKKKVLDAESYFSKLNVSSRTLIANLGYYLIITVTFLTALGMVGLDFTSLTVVVGALSIGIGFGLQNIVSNFISGIILIFEKSIRVGDYIEISDALKGKVTDIRMRAVTITTNDGVDVLVPNQTFIQNNVVNWTLRDDTRRLHIPFGVAYGTPVEKVKKVVLEALAASELIYIRDNEDKKPVLWMVQMNSSSVDYELLVWINGPSSTKPSGIRSEFMIMVYNTLYENGITIPFPQLDVHMISSLPDNKPGV